MFHGVRSAPRNPTVHEQDSEKSTPHTLFTTPEHRHLGNHITLRWPDSTAPTGVTPLSATSPAAAFDLQALDPSLNALRLTYGSITSLAGDFYGTYAPISDGATLEDRIARFTSSWNLLARERPSVFELDRILRIEHRLELDPLARADPSEPPSAVYARMSDLAMTHAWFLATRCRTPENGYTTTYPGYVGLVLTNWDHFGTSAHTAYAAGHTAALRVAASGTKAEDLKLAYAMNAFADHFLEDAFSAGHLRTPRRALHDQVMDLEKGGLSGLSVCHLPTADLCASLMHDEDSALGLEVENLEGEHWTCYGDDYLFDKVGNDTLRLCVNAIQRSVDEVYEAFSSRKVKDQTDFGALKLAPTIESANGKQRLAPLFKVDASGKVLRRGTDLQKRTWGGLPIPGVYEVKRTDWNDYTDEFWYATTWIQCKASGAWEWPLKMDDDLKVGEKA